MFRLVVGVFVVSLKQERVKLTTKEHVKLWKKEETKATMGEKERKASQLELFKRGLS